MKEGLIGQIQRHGHWRVNIRPIGSVGERLSFQRLRELVQKSSVSIRGWDYPHISRRNDESGGISNTENYVESWTDWSGFIEFWRMYRSSQFLSYFCLRSDTGAMGREVMNVPILNIVDAVYSMSEFLEFAHRLFSNGIYREGAIISVSLKNSNGRQLDVGPSRIPFFDQKISHAENIVLEQTLSKSVLTEGYKEMAIQMLLDLFDHFDWNPDPSQLRNDQERFFNRDFRH
jgi:hypothetical protein